LLRQVGGLDADLGQHLRDAVFAFAEQLQHPDPRRMAECLEELGFQLVQRSAHRYHLSTAATAVATAGPAGHFIHVLLNC
jgi:hypothetical protein